jgi:hypothetical protein
LRFSLKRTFQTVLLQCSLAVSRITRGKICSILADFPTLQPHESLPFLHAKLSMEIVDKVTGSTDFCRSQEDDAVPTHFSSIEHLSDVAERTGQSWSNCLRRQTFIFLTEICDRNVCPSEAHERRMF